MLTLDLDVSFNEVTDIETLDYIGRLHQRIIFNDGVVEGVTRMVSDTVRKLYRCGNKEYVSVIQRWFGFLCYNPQTQTGPDVSNVCDLQM